MGKKKRGNGEGWIRQRSDGRWNVGISFWTTEGIRRRETTKKTHGEALKWLDGIKREIFGGPVISSENPRLGEYLESWLEESVRGDVSTRTYRFYRSSVTAHIAPALGHVKLRSLDARRIQSFYGAKLKQGLAQKTRRDIHTTLRKALKQAAAWGMLQSNPTESVRVPRGAGKIRTITPFSLADLDAIKAAAEGKRIPAIYPFAAATGLRPQEVCALTWEDLTLPERGPGRVNVDKAVKEGENGYYIGPPKNDHSYRSVDFSEGMVALLRRHRSALNEERLAARVWREGGYVFPHSRGGFMDRHTLSRLFAPVRAAAGLEGHSFRDFRHTFATLLFQRGKHPKEVQHLLGHSSIKITMDTYSHYIPSEHQGAADALGDIF